jgi:hypothetical protein
MQLKYTVVNIREQSTIRFVRAKVNKDNTYLVDNLVKYYQTKMLFIIARNIYETERNSYT